MKSKLRAWEISALFALCAALCAGTWAQGRQESISSQMLRLHVIAASDDEREQSVKLRVRDAVLEYLTPRLAQTDSAEQAREVISGSLEDVARSAYAAAEGRGVEVRLCRESYPTREYEGFTLPAGEYESLQVILGAGEGHNWWCVVFPPVCLSMCEADSVKSVMDSGDYAIVTEDEGYELRFRTVELWGRLMEKLKGAS